MKPSDFRRRYRLIVNRFHAELRQVAADHMEFRARELGIPLGELNASTEGLRKAHMMMRIERYAVEQARNLPDDQVAEYFHRLAKEIGHGNETR